MSESSGPQKVKKFGLGGNLPPSMRITKVCNCEIFPFLEGKYYSTLFL